MKSLKISEEILKDRELGPLVKQASEILERELGSSSSTVSASWIFGQEQGRPVVWLELSDFDSTGSVEGRFSRDDLKNPRQTAARIIRLWGDLLQTRSHKQAESFAKDSQRMDGEEVLDLISDAICEFAEQKGTTPKLLKLPIRYAIALMKLGPAFWGDWFQQIRERGVRAIDEQPLFGVPVKLAFGVDTKFEVE